MRANGFGRNLENAVVFEGDQVLSPGGLRWRMSRFCTKCWMLGDLALAGARFLAAMSVSGQACMTNRLLQTLSRSAMRGRSWNVEFQQVESCRSGCLPQDIQFLAKLSQKKI
jgi:UDP-3-O-acyl-N-acetylglucosamine deacetylase